MTIANERKSGVTEHISEHINMEEEFMATVKLLWWPTTAKH